MLAVGNCLGMKFLYLLGTYVGNCLGVQFLYLLGTLAVKHLS